MMPVYKYQMHNVMIRAFQANLNTSISDVTSIIEISKIGEYLQILYL